ncbi:hypothetical protein NIES208_13505 [[Limnothrix rosea] IAM M-220]|nr:hypothetical protein NIES208_13505 [[Limnothrix rosea] IAM M-220]
MSDCGCAIEARNAKERQTLLIVLGINAFMFVFELILGLVAESTGLIADSLDMLADACVYSISLYAIGRSNILKRRAAKFSGIVQSVLAFFVIFEAIRRFIFGSEPLSLWIIAVGCLALIANSICLTLISKHKNGEVHMRASAIFSANDVIANIGVILSGVLVLLLDSRYPDLIIGLIIAAIVFRGGLKIIQEAQKSNSTYSESS